jgi:hypothetical protein
MPLSKIHSIFPVEPPGPLCPHPHKWDHRQCWSDLHANSAVSDNWLWHLNNNGASSPPVCGRFSRDVVKSLSRHQRARECNTSPPGLGLRTQQAVEEVRHKKGDVINNAVTANAQLQPKH